MSNENFLIILSSPSGGGKSTLCRMILERNDRIRYSVSATTRRPRSGEKDGEDYNFMTEDDFLAKRDAGYFAESALVHGHWYGTPVINIVKAFEQGMDVLMDIDVQGAVSLMKSFPDAVSIFVIPPSMDVLMKRLSGRGTDTKEQIERRIANAEMEMKARDKFRFSIVNSDIEEAYSSIVKIINDEKLKRRT